MKKSFTGQRTAIVFEMLDLINESIFEMITVRNLKFVSGSGQAGMILNEDEMYIIFDGSDQNKITIPKNIIQTLHDKVYSILFPLRSGVWKNLTLSETYSLEYMEKQNLLQMVKILYQI